MKIFFWEIGAFGPSKCGSTLPVKMRKYLKGVGPAAPPLSERLAYMPRIGQSDQPVFDNTTGFCER
jgi:hypothetical protein